MCIDVNLKYNEGSGNGLLQNDIATVLKVNGMTCPNCELYIENK